MNSTTDIIAKLNSTLSYKRKEHCISTSEYALFLSKQYHSQVSHIPVDDIIRSALVHDICREWKVTDLVDYVKINHLEVTEEELNYPVLLHAPVAASKMGGCEILDKEYMKKAVRWHSLGSIKMGLLGALLFSADYMELHRGYVSDEKREKLLMSRSLEELTQRIIELHVQHMKDGGKQVASSTHELYEFLSAGGTFL